jgi:hypothetical protein
MPVRELQPKRGRSWLTSRQVVRLLRQEFEYVHADFDQGWDDVRECLPALIENGAAEAVLLRIDSSSWGAVKVRLSDDGPDASVSLEFVVVPGEAIKVLHRMLEIDLLKRCVNALGYSARLTSLISFDESLTPNQSLRDPTVRGCAALDTSPTAPDGSASVGNEQLGNSTRNDLRAGEAGGKAVAGEDVGGQVPSQLENTELEPGSTRTRRTTARSTRSPFRDHRGSIFTPKDVLP